MDNFEKVCNAKENVIIVRGAFKHFGSKSKPNPVLVNLNMAVAKGTM